MLTNHQPRSKHLIFWQESIRNSMPKQVRLLALQAWNSSKLGQCFPKDITTVNLLFKRNAKLT